MKEAFCAEKTSFSRKAISGQNAISGQKVISVNVNFIAKKLLKITGNGKFIYVSQNFSTLYTTMYTYMILSGGFSTTLVWNFIVQILTYALFIPQNLIQQKWWLTSQTQVHAQWCILRQTCLCFINLSPDKTIVTLEVEYHVQEL